MPIIKLSSKLIRPEHLESTRLKLELNQLPNDDLTPIYTSEGVYYADSDGNLLLLSELGGYYYIDIEYEILDWDAISDILRPIKDEYLTITLIDKSVWTTKLHPVFIDGNLNKGQIVYNYEGCICDNYVNSTPQKNYHESDDVLSMLRIAPWREVERIDKATEEEILDLQTRGHKNKRGD